MPGCRRNRPAKIRTWDSEKIACIRVFYDSGLDQALYSTDANIPISLGFLANTIGTVKGGGAHTRKKGAI